MAVTDVSICSNSLILLGERPISSLSDGTDVAIICANAYPNLKRAIMSAHGWRFLMVKKALTRASETPAGEWAYSYILPGDALSLAHAVFRDAADGTPSADFEIFGRRVYCDMETVIADYVADKDESQWPGYFVNLVTTANAAQICMAVTGQATLYDRLLTQAYGTPSEMGLGGLMAAAMAADSQGSGGQYIDTSAFVAARFGG